MEVIEKNHMTFLLLQYILDNMFFTQKVIDWAKKKNQVPLVFLKLDFAKAYNKVDWKFFFYVMGELSMAKYFVGKLGFHSQKKVVVCLNNAISSPFTIQLGVRPRDAHLLFTSFL